MTVTDAELSESHYVANEKLINEEYKIWKKSVPFLYDTIQTYVLDSPSLTVESLPGPQLSSDGNELEVNFLIGTLAPKGNSLQSVSFRVPSTLSPTSEKSVPVESGPSTFSKFQINQKWVQIHEVNKARYNKFNDKLAAFDSTGDIRIFKFESSKEIATLRFHKKDGFGLEWAHNSDLLLSGGEDMKVALWDVSKSSSGPIKTYSPHSAIVSDFSWSYDIPTLFGSVSDDLSVQFIDIRSDLKDSLFKIEKAHNDVINAIEFNSIQTNLFVTGSADNLINVWDLRYIDAPLRKLYGHNNAVTNLKFNPEQPNLLASSSDDRRIHIWDLNKIREEFDSDDYLKNDIEDPTLVFIHGGHTANITEFDWVSGAVNTIVSAAEDSLIEIWKPTLEEDEEEEEERPENEENDDQEIKDVE